MELHQIIGYSLGLLMGITLGLIGAGGSALTVPIMVFLFQLDAALATTYSLFIVGLTTLFGSVKQIKERRVAWNFVFLFGIPSIISIFVSRRFILPAIPNDLADFGSFHLTKDSLLLGVFSLVLIGASYSMIKKQQIHLHDENKPVKNTQLIIGGLVVGLVTGMLGAGGGFLIIPALVLWGNLPMKKATATSLMIITINSILGFMFDKHGIRRIDWGHMFIFSVLAISGIFTGIKLSEYISGEKLKPIFGWFILAMGVFILFQQISGM
jgi:uncharacterized membrane protein YfcA